MLTDIPPTLGKIRASFTPYQTQVLLKRYEAEPYLELEEIDQLAQSLNISEKKARRWFTNRRARQKEKGILRGGE